MTVAKGNVVTNRLTIHSGLMNVLTKGLTISSGVIVSQGLTITGLNILSSITGMKY